ncbi:hypothetical protein E5D57_003593 [Metarhizium anisopliae]|nr:hypothetical protein E5D57_003593 [Metarhizium anisopliae]
MSHSSSSMSSQLFTLLGEDVIVIAESQEDPGDKGSQKSELLGEKKSGVMENFLGSRPNPTRLAFI